MKFFALSLFLIVNMLAIQAQDSATIYYRLADKHYNNKQHEDAKHNINQSICLHPTDSAYLLRAKMQGETNKAFADLDSAVMLNPNYAAAYLERGTYHLNHNYEKSLRDFLEVIKLWPDSAVGYEWLGLLHWEYEFYHEAIDYYTKAINIHTTDASLYSNRARIKMEVKEFVSAIEDLNTAIKHTTPDRSGSFYQARGMCKYYLNDIAGCCEDLSKALELGARSAANDYKELCVPKK